MLPEQETNRIPRIHLVTTSGRYSRVCSATLEEVPPAGLCAPFSTDTP